MKFTVLLLFAACAASGARAGAASLAIDVAQSRVEITVTATVDSFVARLAAYDATVTVDDVAETVTGARFAFRFADVKTGNDSRDEEMLAWEENAKHPEGLFVLSDLTPVAGGGARARGTLTLHGVTREIEFPVSVTHDRSRYAIDGEVLIDTRDHGLPIIRKFLLLKVDPSVAVRFHLQGAITVDQPR